MRDKLQNIVEQGLDSPSCDNVIFYVFTLLANLEQRDLLRPKFYISSSVQQYSPILNCIGQNVSHAIGE